MLKRFVTTEPAPSPTPTDQWLDLEPVAAVEVTSEQANASIESALLPNSGESGWRAAEPGDQTIRLRFATPLHIHLIHLLFVEEEKERVQEFVLRWQSAGNPAYQEIVRQQYVFTPPGTTEELESYQVELHDLIALELSIVPDISRRTRFATLRELRLA